MKINLYPPLICNLFFVLLLIQSNGFRAEQGFNSSMGEVKMESMVSITSGYPENNSREDGEAKESNDSIGSGGGENGRGEGRESDHGDENRREENDSSESDEQSTLPTTTTTTSPISSFVHSSSSSSSTENGDNENEEDKLMSYIEGKILEIVPISEVPYESFTENYHEIDPNDSHDNETISKTTSTTTITIPTERSTSADLEIEESSLHHQISSLSAESDDGDIKRNGNGNDEKSNHDETPVDVTESTSKQQQDENINHNNNTNGNSALSSSASPHLASSPLSKVNDLRTSANSVAVKVTEVKKKSLAAKMMERLRKSDKDESCSDHSHPSHSRYRHRRPSSLLSEAKDLVYVNAGTDDAKKNIIVVSNGGSGGGGGSHGGHSGLNGGGSRHHHHHHLQSHLSPTEQQIPGHQVVPIFTPIDEHPHLQQQNQAHGQQIGGHHHHHGNDPESHGQAYPLFQDGRGGSSGNGNGGGRGEEGRSILPGETPSSAGHHIDGHLGSLGSNIGNGGGDANSGGGGNGEITGHPHHVHGLSGSPGNPGNLDSPVDSPWPPHVGSLVGPNSEPTDALGRGGGGGGGHTLTHHDPITAGGPISSISGSSGPTSAEHLHHRFQSGSLGELVRAAGLTLNPPRSEQMSPEITPFFETSKSDSRGDTLINPLTGNTASSLKGFSLLSDSASLSNLRSLLGGSSSSDLTSSLLGSSLTSGSGGSSSTSSGPSSGSLNDRLLSSLLEQSSKTSTLDDLNEQLNPLHGAGHHHALTELTSSRLGSSSGLLGEDIGFDDALKRLTMIEMLNKKQIPLTTTLIDELRGEPSPLHTLSGVNGNPLSLLDGDLRKLKNLQQLAQVQQAIKKSQQTSLKAKSSFDQIGGQLEDDDQPQDHRSGNNNEGRAAISTRYRLSGNINGANRGSSSIESGPTGERRIRPGQKVKTLDALTKLRQQRERFRDHFRPSTKSKMEEEEEEYEESGVEHEGDESRSLLLGWKKPSRSEVDSTILTDNFHHLNGQVTDSLAALIHSPETSESSKLSPHPHHHHHHNNHYQPSIPFGQRHPNHNHQHNPHHHHHHHHQQQPQQQQHPLFNTHHHQPSSPSPSISSSSSPTHQSHDHPHLHLHPHHQFLSNQRTPNILPFHSRIERMVNNANNLQSDKSSKLHPDAIEAIRSLLTKTG